jgi:hypothetical protein
VQALGRCFKEAVHFRIAAMPEIEDGQKNARLGDSVQMDSQLALAPMNGQGDDDRR